MIDFIKKLEERIASEQEKMVGKAILYAENSEAFNRNGYMTHKYARNVLREVVAEYKEVLSKLVEAQEARKQEEKQQSNVQELTDKAPVSKPTRLKDMDITLGSNLNKSSSKEESKTSDTPKKSAPKRGRPKKGGESKK